MSYTLKSIRYHNEPRKILLQNENGPCPLLAAANALLLRGLIQLPPACVQTNHASIDDVVNTLAERALRNSNPISTSANDNQNQNQNLNQNLNQNQNQHETEDGRAYQINELLSIFPSLQYGMDVNPKLGSGPTGVEYTKNLTAFDLMGVELVHGWLVDSQDVTTKGVIGTRTYNELAELVVMGKDAEKEMERLEGEIEDLENEINSLEKESIHQLMSPLPNGGEEDGHGDADADADGGVEGDGDTGDTANTANTGDTGDVEGQGTVEDNKEEEWIDVSPLDEEKSSTGVATVPSNTSDTSDTSTNETQPNPDTEPENIDNDLAKVKDFMDNLDNDLELKERLGPVIADGKRRTLHATRQRRDEQKRRRMDGSVVNAFLTETSNQLTVSGLAELQHYVNEHTVCVFFRNNHFATITKEDGALYLLVTDLGYAGVNEVVWEKLDDITGDTEFTDDLFETSKPRDQSEVDYQIALQLSQDVTTVNTQEERQVATAIEASMLDNVTVDRHNTNNNVKKEEEQLANKVRDDDAASELLARRLQAEESSPNPDYVQGNVQAANRKQNCIIS